MHLLEKAFWFDKSSGGDYPIKKNIEKALDTDGAVEIVLTDRSKFYIVKLSVFNKFYDENRLTGYGRAFARQLFNRGHKTLHLAFSEDKGSYIPPQEGKDYFLCTDDFRVFKNETYFESLEAISEELEVSFISEETQRVTNLILEGKDVHKVLSFHESTNKEFKTAAGQFPKKMEAFYIEVGGVNEAAIKIGRAHV